MHPLPQSTYDSLTPKQKKWYFAMHLAMLPLGLEHAYGISPFGYALNLAGLFFRQL